MFPRAIKNYSPVICWQINIRNVGRYKELCWQFLNLRCLRKIKESQSNAIMLARITGRQRMWFTEARSPRGWQSEWLSSGDVVEHDRTSLAFLSQDACLDYPKVCGAWRIFTHGLSWEPSASTHVSCLYLWTSSRNNMDWLTELLRFAWVQSRTLNKRPANDTLFQDTIPSPGSV